MYAVTIDSFRAVNSINDVQSHEQFAVELTESLLRNIAAKEIRLIRNTLLRESDWTQMGDNSLSAIDRAAFAVYRQALRDLPSLPEFPYISFPTIPTIPSNAGDELPEQS